MQKFQLFCFIFDSKPCATICIYVSYKNTEVKACIRRHRVRKHLWDSLLNCDWTTGTGLPNPFPTHFKKLYFVKWLPTPVFLSDYMLFILKLYKRRTIAKCIGLLVTARANDNTRGNQHQWCLITKRKSHKSTRAAADERAVDSRVQGPHKHANDEHKQLWRVSPIAQFTRILVAASLASCLHQQQTAGTSDRLPVSACLRNPDRFYASGKYLRRAQSARVGGRTVASPLTQ